eukprot:Hpha_TRINITY_DN11112_c0_g1::TRINITY_DN11112_c0_g1_i3::g.28086::m.28086/K15376/GPHN; gephyrin
MAGQDDLESFAWRELVAHLREHAEVQNIDLMNLAGFCRNCLSKWLFLGAHRLGRRMEYDEAVFAVYGMTIKDWKARHQTEATPEALKRFKEGQSRHAKIDVDTKQPSPGSDKPSISVVSRPRESQHLMMEMDEALKCIEKQTPGFREAPAEMVPLSQAVGRTAAQNIACPYPHPPFPASIKDGYAVRSEDGPGVYPVELAVAAGMNTTILRMPRGTVCRVSTGAAVPEGADAVVQVEDTALVEADAAADKELRVEIKAKARPGQDIRPVGSDIPEGTTILTAGEVIGPAEVGLLTAAGIREVPVRRKLVVAVLSTGTELLDPTVDLGLPSARGTIFDSNRPMLKAALESDYFGCTVLDLGIVQDEPETAVAALRSAFEKADVVISSGGVSMGEKDLMKAAVESLGCTMHFGRVEMKPGKPTTFATFEKEGRRHCYFGLPGNPVSSFVCLHLFARPAIRRMQGHTDLHARRVTATVGGSVPLQLDPERPEFHRCTLEWNDQQGGFVALSTGKQASHRLLSARSAAGLMTLPKGSAQKPQVLPGEKVGIVLLGRF